MSTDVYSNYSNYNRNVFLDIFLNLVVSCDFSGIGCFLWGKHRKSIKVPTDTAGSCRLNSFQVAQLVSKLKACSEFSRAAWKWRAFKLHMARFRKPQLMAMACYGHLWPNGKPTQISPPPQEMSAEVHGTNGWNFKLRNAKRTGGLHMPSPWIKLTWLKQYQNNFWDAAAWQAGARGPLQLKVRCSVCRLPQSMWPPSCGKSFRACNLKHRPVGWWKSENHQTKPTVQSSTSAKAAKGGHRGPWSNSLCALSSNQWEIQDPKMEVLYHIRAYFVGIFPYIGLT